MHGVPINPYCYVALKKARHYYKKQTSIQTIHNSSVKSDIFYGLNFMKYKRIELTLEKYVWPFFDPPLTLLVGGSNRKDSHPTPEIKNPIKNKDIMMNSNPMQCDANPKHKS